MPLHESKLNLPPRLVISSARIDKTDGVGESKGGDRGIRSPFGGKEDTSRKAHIAKKPQLWLRFSNSSKGYMPG